MMDTEEPGNIGRGLPPRRHHGELRDRTFENQSHRAADLNLYVWTDGGMGMTDGFRSLRKSPDLFQRVTT